MKMIESNERFGMIAYLRYQNSDPFEIFPFLRMSFAELDESSSELIGVYNGKIINSYQFILIDRPEKVYTYIKNNKHD